MALLELTFRRASVHLVHDAQRLEDGQDLNDALLDFFVKLGQALLPEGSPSVAYLGSHFYDVLRKGGAKDGREGHKNVANWARRRLGKEGLFSDSIGALAVPVNEVLQNSYDGAIREEQQEKHWWLALLLNPRAVSSGRDDDLSVLCLDSFVRSETRFEPPIRALRNGGKTPSYFAEVSSLQRVGFAISCSFRAGGDGSAGPLAEPRKARLRAGGRSFPNLECVMRQRERGGEGVPGKFEGSLSFRLDRRGAAKTVGQFLLEYGEQGEDYQPQLKLRMGEKPNFCQAEVARYLGGYLARESEVAGHVVPNAGGNANNSNGATKVEGHVCLPGVPQQETSHDCGFFILEQILRTLQLDARSLRDLATASSVEIAMLPWPSQKQVLRRKSMLRDAMGALFNAARQANNADVEALMQADPALKERIRLALKDGCPSFQKGFERWETGDWDLSPSASRSRSRGRRRSGSGSQNRKKKKKKEKKEKDKEKKRRRDDTRSRSPRRSGSASRSRSRSSTRSPSRNSGGKPNLPSFTMQEIEGMSAGALRTLCIQWGVLPAGVVEREDLVRALAPKAKAAPPPKPSAPSAAAAVVAAAAAAAAEAAKSVKAAGGASAATPSSAGAGNGTFTRAGLEAMPSKELRALCIRRGVLPSGLVERGDLIGALAPLAVG